MALRNNVKEVHEDLWHEVRPIEFYIVVLILNKTIGWNRELALFTIKELKEKTKQTHSHVYEALKSLENKKIIIRSKGEKGIILGLNFTVLKKYDSIDL